MTSESDLSDGSHQRPSNLFSACPATEEVGRRSNRIYQLAFPNQVVEGLLKETARCCFYQFIGG